MSYITKPVTQVADAAVKNEFRKGVASPLLDATGKLNSILPNNIITNVPKAIICVYDNLSFLNMNIKISP